MVSLITSAMNSLVWVNISQACLLLSCYSNNDTSIRHNYVLAFILLGACLLSSFTGPTILTAIVVMLISLFCSILKSEKSKISTQFLTTLIIVGLVFEYFMPGSLYYFSLNQTIYLIMLIGSLISINTLSVSFAPVIALTLFCIGASFEQIQFYILILLLLDVLKGNFNNIARTSLLLLIWTSPSHLWILTLFALYVVPSSFAKWIYERNKLTAVFALAACLTSEIQIGLRVVIIIFTLLTSVKVMKYSKRVSNA